MRVLGLVGLIALLFGLLPFWVTDELGWFSLANFCVAGVALVVAIASALARLRNASQPVYRRALGRGLATLALAILAAIALERAATRSSVQLDWSFERKFELSEATREALAALGQVRAHLYFDALDPRVRSTRLLLSTMAQTGHLRFDERELDAYPEEEHCYAIGSSNTVVVRLGDGPPCEGRFERVERPTEGTLFEALSHLRPFEASILYVARGAGEGDLTSLHETGYSGLAAALATEGYRLRELVLAAVSEIPRDADAVLLLAPRRALRPEARAALDRYLEGGGRLVAWLEPGVASGAEEVLARWGLRSPDAVVVDPASGPSEGSPSEVNPLAFHYASDHPIASGLGPNRMTFFRGVRSFELHKPEPDDELETIVYSSARAWLVPDPGVLGAARVPPPPPGTVASYHALVVAGRYPRAGSEARIVAFGDAELASNRYLRTLYNLDLVLNAVHWATQREPDITIRPKVRGAVSGRLQFPIPVQDTLGTFQGLGLLLPELLLIVGVVVWARGRAA